MQYQTVTTIVDAVQWWPPDDDRHDPVATPVHPDRITKRKIGKIYASATPDKWYLIQSESTWLELFPARWIITKPDGSKFLCRPEEFKKLYKKIAIPERQLVCPECKSTKTYWRKGVHFDHEKMCGSCGCIWEP